MELNLQNFNQYDDMKEINNMKDFKNKIKKENVNTETIKDSSSDYKKNKNSNLNNEAVKTFNENFNKKEIDKYNDFTTNTNKEMYYLKDNRNEYNDYKIEVKNKITNVDNFYCHDDSIQMIDSNEIIEKFMNSDQIKFLVEEKVLIEKENKSKKNIDINTKIKDSSNGRKFSDDKVFNKKNKFILLEKLTNFQIEENNNLTIINKIINSKNNEFYINNNCYNINSFNKASVLIEDLLDYKSNSLYPKNKNENLNINNNLKGNYKYNKKIFIENCNNINEKLVCFESFLISDEDKWNHSKIESKEKNENINTSNKVINCNYNNNQNNKEIENISSFFSKGIKLKKNDFLIF
jgi:hypothetical protein